MLTDEQFTVQKSASPCWRVGTMALVSAVALGLSLVTVRPFGL